MNTAKLKKLQAAGWKAGSAQDFLELRDEEAMLGVVHLDCESADIFHKP